MERREAGLVSMESVPNLEKKNEARAMPKRPGLREEANLLLAVNPGIVSQKGCCSSCHHNRDPHRKKKVKG